MSLAQNLFLRFAVLPEAAMVRRSGR